MSSEERQESYEKGRKRKYSAVYKKRRRVFGQRKYEPEEKK